MIHQILQSRTDVESAKDLKMSERKCQPTEPEGVRIAKHTGEKLDKRARQVLEEISGIPETMSEADAAHNMLAIVYKHLLLTLLDQDQEELAYFAASLKLGISKEFSKTIRNII